MLIIIGGYVYKANIRQPPKRGQKAAVPQGPLFGGSTVIQKLSAARVSWQSLCIIVVVDICCMSKWDQLMSPPTLKIMDEKTHVLQCTFLVL